MKTINPGPILESKSMHEIFQRKDKNKLKRTKKGKIFENWSKNVQNLKIFWKKGFGLYNKYRKIICYNNSFLYIISLETVSSEFIYFRDDMFLPCKSSNYPIFARSQRRRCTKTRTDAVHKLENISRCNAKIVKRSESVQKG